MPRTRRVARRADAPPRESAPVEDDPAGTKAEFVHVDEIFNEEKCTWDLRDSAPYEPKHEDSERSPYHDYCFLVKKRYQVNSAKYTRYIVIKSKQLRDALNKAINDSTVIYSYVDEPEVIPDSFLPYYYILLEYLDNLDAKTPEDSDDSVIQQLDLLLDFLRTEYSTYLAAVDAQIANGVISFDNLRAILIPGREFYIADSLTGQPRAVILREATKHQNYNESCYYALSCEYLESYGRTPTETSDSSRGPFGRATQSTIIQEFKGTRKINSFRCFPMEYHPRKEQVRRMLISRGKKWASYDGMHHVTYNGVGYIGGVKHYFKGRSIIDKATYRRINPHSGVPVPDRALRSEYDGDDIDETMNSDTQAVDERGLTEDDYVLATPILYGFSLEDKEWATFCVDLVEKIVWSDEAFDNLVLPAEKKSLIKSLVETHGDKRKGAFDDFVVGKGRGLVVNLFGPPGVGKTMSAEATSEHLRKPLYVVGAGDLGTNSHSLDAMLSQIFDIGHTWNAVVLIDEADVFLEERSVHDLERNALVAIFLRQLEYFAGILFLTTNRVKTFDPAFASRIHIALHYNELDEATKGTIWKAFLAKVDAVGAIEEKEWEILRTKNVNGRQIKNAVKTAQALAHSRQESLTFAHIDQVLTVMEQFERDLLRVEGV
ncbi:related to TOB3 (member of AAA-ATPase family) [Serendipita indica DSM 11827]|uniref:Related to TOB3 (Member of AAA-ATPase family) n=1 Tax=Serendipita indica (strain DSM 11827) TaxID=1109443 RepID=G4T9U2_SERID|nr:related to TOB3 (member of AAA-ATPase family) [Serendipita indica DSM 11827]